jgi:hypothetical protein
MCRWLARVCIGVVLVSQAGCSAEPSALPSVLGDAELVASPSSPNDPLIGLPCAENEVESCAITLSEHAGVISCYEGKRSCSDGAWGACVDGYGFELSRSELGLATQTASLRPLALSAPSECENNPCNSYCREFNEVPDNGISAELDDSAPPLSLWTTGNLSDYPPEWVGVGAVTPCQVAGDCQFNTACNDPALGSCGHSVCATGETLAAGCSRCADTVCAIDADCCSEPVCSHDPCEVGSAGPLDRGCDTCTAAVCAVHPECCDVSWDAACVGYVAVECAPLGQTCGCPVGSIENAGGCYATGGVPRDWGLARDACGVFGEGWTLIEINDVEENALAQSFLGEAGLGSAWLGGLETGTDQWIWQRSGETFFVSDADGGQLQGGHTFENWAESEPELGVAGRGIAMDGDGGWHDAPLTFEFDYVCEGPPNRLGPKQPAFTWSDSCVALAALECGVQCPESAALGLGSCDARVPTQLDAACASFDLALGATCEAAGLPQIPVCNHGQASAPAGLRLSHLPVSELGRATPDLSAAGSCTLSEAIPPGRCVTISDCPGLTPDRALVVNPRDGSEDSDECRLDDNWTIYQPVPCRPPVCEADVYDAAQVAANDCSVEVNNPLTIDTALASVNLAVGVPQPHCGENELLFGASCYFVSTEVQTWDLARDRCQSRGDGWDLVSLNSPAENAWARSQTSVSKEIQIGLNDTLSEGDHVWSNGTCRKYLNWNTLQPNNVPPGSEQCTRMAASPGGEWEDKACNDGEHVYVCEGPVQGARGGCAGGQVAGPDGSCYAFDPTEQSSDDARSACQELGPGWDLALIDDANTNDFVTGLLGCSSAWLRNPPAAFTNWAGAESIDLSNPPYIDELGFWHTLGAPIGRARLCQGPASASVAPALSQVASLASCSVLRDDQYYFEGNSVAPELLKLCPSTCTLAASLSGRRLEVNIPCAPPPQPALQTTVGGMFYKADCPGGSTLWDFFYYDSVTPADSRIEFEIRTGTSQEALEADTIPFIPIAAAHAVPQDTQRCETPPNCPVDIFNLLGDPAQQQNVLELRVHLFPGSSGEGPLLRDWKVRFSCPPSQ